MEQSLLIDYLLFKSENNLVISAVEKSEDDNGYIIRLFNGKDHQDIGDRLTFNFDITEAYYTNLKEEKIDKIDIVEDGLIIKLYKIIKLNLYGIQIIILIGFFNSIFNKI